MLKNKIFQFEDYKNCSFIVSHYLADNKAIAIIIEDNITRETIKCTTYIQEIEYKVGIATIKNYSENRGMTKFLKSLGVVTEVLEKKKVNELAEDTETIDICKIDLNKLREFATEWHYEGEKNMEKKDVSENIKIGIEKMLEENKLNLFVVKDEILTSTELGKTFEKSGQAVNVLLNKAGYLEENDNKEEKSKWKLTEKGKQFAVTPIKQLITIIDEYNILVRQKKENPKWLGKMRLELKKIILEEKENETE